MLEFFSANLPTLLVGAVVFGVIALVVVKLVKDKLNHKSSCGCGCSGCPGQGGCHGDK